MRAKSTFKYIAIAALALVSLQVPANKAGASVSINVRIGAFPNLVPVPGYPVYYAPSLDNNLFFYDGLYWLYVDDDWYSSSWYDGPWDWVDRFDVPTFILRVPVRYYPRPPIYFRAWSYSAPPRWGEHWGRDWDDRRRGWDRWDHARVPPPAPLPFYQRDYRGDRYPRGEQQGEIMQRNYRYAPGQHSGFQPRNEPRDEGRPDRDMNRGLTRPVPNPAPNLGPNLYQRGDRFDSNRRDMNRDGNRPPDFNRPGITPPMNDRDNRRNNHQWNREAAPQPGLNAPREIAPPAQPREPGSDRARRPWSNNAPNNDRQNNGPDNRGGGPGGNEGGGLGPMRNHDRGRDR